LEKELFTPGGVGRVISISRRITEDIIRLYGYPRERISLISNGTKFSGLPSAEERAGVRHTLGIDREEKVILFVGTGWERKGLRFAITAVERLGDPSIRLLVAGRGRQRSYASPVVRFLGSVSAMRQLYSAADVLVAPSIYEPFSLAGVEALGSGIPVVASKAVGLTELMTTGVHGEVIDDPSDVDALTGALRKWSDLMRDPVESERIRAACATLASEFTLERNLRETLDVIRKVIAEKKG
jgi:UDP-glucose:(heptosyl)LPS alpha-1,3-glucosyltransferase